MAEIFVANPDGQIVLGGIKKQVLDLNSCSTLKDTVWLLCLKIRRWNQDVPKLITSFILSEAFNKH